MSPIKIMLAGDSHGDDRFLVNVLRRASEKNIDNVFVLGDFGIFPRLPATNRFLDKVDEAARKLGIDMFALRGNHDDDAWWADQIVKFPAFDGFGFARDNIFLSPTVNYFNWADKKFLVVGGAVSIDKQWSLTDEATDNMPGAYWFPGEQLSDEDLATVTDEKVDYLLTHDCSDVTPFRHSLVPDPDSQDHRRKIDEVISRCRPDMHFHGHMHARYDWVNVPYSTGHETRTFGLCCNGMTNAYGILDTEENTFEWGGRYA